MTWIVLILRTLASHFHRKQEDFFNRVSSVDMATDCGLKDRMIGIRFPAGAGNFSLHHRFQTISGAHTASYPMDTGGCFPGSKATGA
jgi:hypothetical protein